MNTCVYCGNGGVPEPDTVHAACGAEFDRRQAEGLCVFCGENIADNAAGSCAHRKCSKSLNFSGYQRQ